MQSIDLNADLGESFGPWQMGDDSQMLAIVTSASVACGGHASDPETMYATLELARRHNVVVGAHPGYNDREGFGRRIIPMAPVEISRMVAAQIGALTALAAMTKTSVRFVKPHGALGNLAAANREVADAIIAAVRELPGNLAVLAMYGTEFERSARAAGLRVFSEIFADRAYQVNGQLVPRAKPDAMLHDPDQAADRLIRFFETGRMPVIDGKPIPLEAQSICVHGDSAGAVAMARHIKQRLAKAGLTIAPFIA